MSGKEVKVVVTMIIVEGGVTESKVGCGRSCEGCCRVGRRMGWKGKTVTKGGATN